MRNKNEQHTQSEAECLFCCCCLYGGVCLPPNLIWLFLGPLFFCYDKPAFVLPQQFSTAERACFPLDQAAERNIPSRCCPDVSAPTGFAACAPYFWMRFFCEEIGYLRSLKSKTSTSTTPTAPHFHNPMGAPSMETSSHEIQPR